MTDSCITVATPGQPGASCLAGRQAGRGALSTPTFVPVCSWRGQALPMLLSAPHARLGLLANPNVLGDPRRPDSAGWEDTSPGSQRALRTRWRHGRPGLVDLCALLPSKEIFPLLAHSQLEGLSLTSHLRLQKTTYSGALLPSNPEGVHGTCKGQHPRIGASRAAFLPTARSPPSRPADQVAMLRGLCVPCPAGSCSPPVAQPGHEEGDGHACLLGRRVRGHALVLSGLSPFVFFFLPFFLIFLSDASGA